MKSIIMKPKPSREELAAICENYTPTELAKKYDRDRQTIYKWLKDYDLHALRLKRSYGGKRKLELDMETIKKLADQNIPYASIGEQYGVSRYVIARRLQEAGWEKQHTVVCEPKGVNCADNPKYMKKCKYGSIDCCLYICHTGKRRPCPGWDCTVYEKAGKRRWEYEY